MRSIETASSAELVRRCAAVAGVERRAVVKELRRRGELVVLDFAEDQSLRNDPLTAEVREAADQRLTQFVGWESA